MTVIALNTPEDHPLHGKRLQVRGAARHAVLTTDGPFYWCPHSKRWAWASDRAVTLHWPDPASLEHTALMGEFAEKRPPRRRAEGEEAR